MNVTRSNGNSSLLATNPLNSADEQIAGQSTSLETLQLAVYCLFTLIGLPVNLSTLIYMIQRYRHAKSFLLLLHINLNVSDILVLGIFVPGHIIWTVSFEWPGGALLCRLMRYIDAFVFALSSNIMVCIAVYRLCALRFPLWVSAVGHSRVPCLLLVAWSIAFISMLPQLFVWQGVYFGPPYNIYQCVNMWSARHFLNTSTESDNFFKNLYSLQNTIIIFYLPLIILIVCYALILKDIYATLNSSEEGVCNGGASSALYMSEISKLSSCSKAIRGSSKREKEKEVYVSISARGQDKFRRAKVRSLRITLMLIFTYIVTWLPYNILTLWPIFNYASYEKYEETMNILQSLVVLNSVTNPLIYGRFQGIKLIFSCRETVELRHKKFFKLLRR